MWVRDKTLAGKPIRLEDCHTALGVSIQCAAPKGSFRETLRAFLNPEERLQHEELVSILTLLYSYPAWSPLSHYEVVDPRLSRHWAWKVDTDKDTILLCHSALVGEDNLLERISSLRWEWDESEVITDEEWARHRNALWDLLTEFGVLPEERHYVGASAVDEALTTIYDCIFAERWDALRQYLLKMELPDRITRAFEPPEKRLEWDLVEAIMGMFYSGELANSPESRWRTLGWIRGELPFAGVKLRVPFTARLPLP